MLLISHVNFSADRLPNEAALCALFRLIRCLADKEKIYKYYLLWGHRDFQTTECPGNKLYEEIKKWPRWF